VKRRILIIGSCVVVLALAGGAGGLYAYDSSRSDVIAKGVTAGGVDVGGLSAAAARDVLERSLSPKVGKPVIVEWKARRWTLGAEQAGVHMNVNRMVNEALTKSRSGSFFHRAIRDLRGKKVSARVPPRVAFSPQKLNAFVERIAKQLDREPVSAGMEPDGISLHVTPSHDGLAVQKRFLKYRILRELRNPDSLHVALVPTRILRPKVSLARLTYKYGTYVTIDRAHFTLRLWKDLKLARTYTIAVGRQGLETPAGEYTIDDKQVNPSWHVPDSPWAGDLAGRVIPPGPDDPIKARWMGFYNGAGIHGTDDVGSLGTAASHGCIRMSIPDVEQLYELVPLHTLIYVG
jgi:L,D-transpeptidase catalytic domain/Putative peptidoglycan binding domain